MLGTVTSTTILEGLRDEANQEAWRAYVERYRPIIVRYALRMGIDADEAEDVAQATLDSFVHGFRAGRYDRSKGRLGAWLMGIAHHRAQDARRARARRVELQPESGVMAQLPDLEPAEADRVWDEEWRSAILRQVLRQVSREVRPRTFRAFELFALEDLSAEAVARELGMTENAVFLAKARILRRVRELMPLLSDIW